MSKLTPEIETEMRQVMRDCPGGKAAALLSEIDELREQLKHRCDALEERCELYRLLEAELRAGHAVEFFINEEVDSSKVYCEVYDYPDDGFDMRGQAVGTTPLAALKAAIEDARQEPPRAYTPPEGQ